jgi:hypothetical protein
MKGAETPPTFVVQKLSIESHITFLSQIQKNIKRSQNTSKRMQHYEELKGKNPEICVLTLYHSPHANSWLSGNN